MTPEELALYNQLLLSNNYMYLERLGLNQYQRKKKWTWNLEFIKQNEKKSLWFLDSSVTFIKRLARKFLIICQCQKRNKKSYLEKLVKSTLTTFNVNQNQTNFATFFRVLQFFKKLVNSTLTTFKRTNFAGFFPSFAFPRVFRVFQFLKNSNIQLSIRCSA